MKLVVTFLKVIPPLDEAGQSAGAPGTVIAARDDASDAEWAESTEPSKSSTDSGDAGDDSSPAAKGPFPSAGPTGLLQLAEANSLLDVAWTPNGRNLAAFDAAGVATLWDVKARTGIDVSPTNEYASAAGAFRTRLRHVAVSADGKTLVVGTSWKLAVINLPDGQIRWETGDEFKMGPLFVDPTVSYVAVLVPDPDNEYDPMVSVRELGKGTELYSSPAIRAESAPDHNYLAVSPRGKLLAVTDSFNAKVRLFEVSGRRELPGIAGAEGARQLAFSADGGLLKLLMGGSEYRQDWNVADPRRPVLANNAPLAQEGLLGKLASEYKLTTTSRNGKSIAAWNPSGDTVQVLDANTGATQTAVNVVVPGLGQGEISCVALSDDGSQIAVGTVDGDILVKPLDVTAGKTPALATLRFTRPDYSNVRYHELLKSPPDKVGFSADKKWLITGGKVTTVWDLQKRRQQIVLTVNDGRDEWANKPKDYVEGGVYAESSGPLAGGLWEVSGFTKMMGPELPYPALVSGWMLQSNGRTLTTSAFGRIQHYDLREARHRGDFNDPRCPGIRSSPDGRFGAAWFVPLTGEGANRSYDSSRPELVVLDAQTAKVKKSIGTFRNPYNTSLSYAGWASHNTHFKLSFTPDARLLAAEVNTQEGTTTVPRIKIWDWQSGKELPTAAKTPVKHLEFVDGGRFLLTVGDGSFSADRGDTQVASLYDVTTGAKKPDDLDLTLGLGGKLKAWAFAPVGNVFATGDEQGMLLIRHLDTGAEQTRIPAHDAPITALGFSGDAQLLASCSSNGEVKIWNVSESLINRTRANSR